MESSAPIISVILPVYNAGSYLKDAIDSILNQTFRDFEFIIINDGSTDNSLETIKAFDDSRIVLIDQANMGLAATLNVGISKAKGKYIARQDQDDISYPERLEKQVDYLESNKEVVLLGTWARIISEDTKLNNTFHQHPHLSSILKFDLLFNNPFVHSSVIFKTDLVKSIGGYDETKGLYEDYKLWSRLAEEGEVANLKEVLIDYRHHASGMSKNFEFYSDNLFKQSLANFEQFLAKQSPEISDLAAVYHLKGEIYSGCTLPEILQIVSTIKMKLGKLYPSSVLQIERREKDYTAILTYRHNQLIIANSSNGIFKRFYCKFKNKLTGKEPVLSII